MGYSGVTCYMGSSLEELQMLGLRLANFNLHN